MLERQVRRREPAVHSAPKPADPPLLRGPQTLLALQRSAGNQSVVRSLRKPGAPRLARLVTSTAQGLRAAGAESGALSYRYLLRALDDYHRTAADPMIAAEHLRDVCQHADSFLSHFARNGHEDQKVVDYVTAARKEADDELKQVRATGAPQMSEAVFPAPAKYSFEWWFNYIFAEGFRLDQSNAKVKDAFAWATAYHAFRIDGTAGKFVANGLGLDYRFADSGDKFRVLQALMDWAFVAVKETDDESFVNVADTHYEPQSAAKNYPAHLPDLKTSGLVYRSDSRKPLREPNKPGEASIQGHGGSVPRTRQHHNDDQVLKEMNMLQAWNPLKDKSLRESLLVRLGKQDNDLNAVVSIAVDPRDAVKFPLPGSDKADGTTVSGGTDFAHLYVIYVPIDSKVLDTSHVIDRETREKTNRGVATFGRGELGSAGIPFESHLIHIVTERHWDDTPGPGQVAYVIGKVHKVERLNEDKWDTLPEPTKQGLAQVLEAVGDGGPMNWIVHGEPEVGNVRHRDMEIMANQDRALIMHPEAGKVIDWPDYTIKVRGGVAATGVDVSVSHGSVGPARQSGRDFYVDWKGYPTLEKLVVEADVLYANDVKEPRKTAPRHEASYKPLTNVAAFTAPAVMATVNGACEVRIRCANPGIDRVELASDKPGSAVAQGKSGDEFVFTWTPEDGVEGFVNLRANAISKGGGQMQAASRRVRVVA